MATEPFDYFQPEFVHEDNAPLWAMSPDFPAFDAFPDFMMQEQEVEAPPPPPPPPLISHRSSFRRYSSPGYEGLKCMNSSESRNIHRRAIEMLRRIPELRQEAGEGPGGGVVGAEMSRGFRHMMRERQRREKLSQSYADLYSMVSSRSKNDKNSIVRSAAAFIRELKAADDALRRRNAELKAKILGSANEGKRIKIRAANQHSAIDSVIGALRCLKNMNVKVKAMRADLSENEISAVMSIDAKIGAADVERALEGALMEADKKLQCQFPGTNKYSQEFFVQNVT